MEITKDKKGPCWIVSHERDGYHEQIWLTDAELAELYDLLMGML